jgi:tetratricopeptide (TPR) repeat protein
MQKKFDEAKQVLDETLTPAFANKPASADLQFVRVGLMGRQGRWTEAEADVNLYIGVKPDNHYGYHTLAALLAITQNQPAYNQLCQKILPMFAGTTDCYIAERVANDCLLLPDSGADLQAVDKLADIAVACTNDSNAIPYFQACKALSEYRQGRFLQAVEWADKALKSSEVFARAKGCAVMAMAQWQLGKHDAARAILAQGNALAQTISPGNHSVDLGGAWVGWLFARISLDEAMTLIQPILTK